MHPYQVGMVSPTGNGRKSRRVASPEPLGPVLKIVREDGVSFAQCPSCGERLTLGTASGHTIHTPSDLAALLVVEMSALEREELRVALLNTRNRVLAVVTVYVGNVSSSLVRIGELFTEAIRRQATSLIIVHCHPSGDPTPSPDDLRLTAEAVAAGRLLDVQVLDHLVIGGGDFVSLRDRGVSFGNCGDHRAGEASLAGSVVHVKYLTGGMVRATYESASAQR